MPKKTFTAARFGEVDSQGDIFMPGCMKPDSTVIVNHEFDYTRKICTASEVKEENGELKVTADIPDKYMDCTPAIGFKVVRFERNKHGGNTLHEITLHMVGLCEKNNADPFIKPLNQQP